MDASTGQKAGGYFMSGDTPSCEEKENIFSLTSGFAASARNLTSLRPKIPSQKFELATARGSMPNLFEAKQANQPKLPAIEEGAQACKSQSVSKLQSIKCTELSSPKRQSCFSNHVQFSNVYAGDSPRKRGSVTPEVDWIQYRNKIRALNNIRKLKTKQQNKVDLFNQNQFMNQFIDSIRIEERNYQSDKKQLQKKLLSINNEFKLTLKQFDDPQLYGLSMKKDIISNIYNKQIHNIYIDQQKKKRKQIISDQLLYKNATKAREQF